MTDHVYTALFPFCGLGGGAMGFAEAEARLFGRSARFVVLGGIDVDPDSCRDFEMLAKAPAWCRDVKTITPPELRERYGSTAPDVVFLSPPCKGASGLLSAKKARSTKYRDLNRLALRWIELMLAAWPDPPRLVLFENVPRLKQRAGGMLRRVRQLLRRAGYVFTDGFHECGELGGLAQIRRRYLLVARLPKRCPALLYQPPRVRVRGCGEVLGELPIPGGDAGGPMHTLPKLSWLNWVRLALIPAGGDWRDLEGVLRDGQPRREVFKRHGVTKWDQPAQTVAGSGSNGVNAVADARAESFGGGRQGVLPWQAPAGTVIGESYPTNGRNAVADPRLVMGSCKPGSYHNVNRVEDWDEPAHTVIGATRPGSGAPSVADPRLAFDCEMRAGTYGVLPWNRHAPTIGGHANIGNSKAAVADPRAPFGNVDRVTPWDGPTGTVTHSPAPSSGAPAVADPRAVGKAYDHGYGVLRWNEPSSTVAGGSSVGQGAYSLADVRVDRDFGGGPYGVMGWQEAASTITGNARATTGRFSVADPRKPPSFTPLIIAADGTWHRPLTTLELAALQSLPTEIDGKPLVLAGSSVSAWRERIGNAVPRKTARAIADRMLVALLEADLGGFSLRGDDLPVWIAPVGVGVHA